jgi:hypothetical protein
MGKVLEGGSSVNVSTLVPDAGLIGTSTLLNRAIHRGVMTPLPTCIAARVEAWTGSPDP